MFLKNFTCFLLLTAFLFSACGKNYTNDLEAEQDQEPQPLPTANVTSESNPSPPPIPANPAPKTDNQATDSDTALPMMNVPTFGYYSLPKNSSPLFSKSCLIVDDPVNCSNEQLGKWMSETLSQADYSLRSGEYSVQYISFEIDEKGKVANVLPDGSEGNAYCPDCLEIALETISKMPNWTPAMRNGEPVKISLKLPVRFQVL